MDRNRFVWLGLAAFGLIFLGFVVRGTARLLIPYEYALALSAPAILGAFAILVYLFVWGVLDLTGFRSIE